MEKQTQLHLHVERPLYEQNVLNEIYNYEKPRATSENATKFL